MRWVVLGTWLLAGAAYAQVVDASVPDASVGMGGADHTSEENDTGPCVSTSDCNRGTCIGGRCVPNKPINAKTGCDAVPGATLALGALVMLLARRNR